MAPFRHLPVKPLHWGVTLRAFVAVQLWVIKGEHYTYVILRKYFSLYFSSVKWEVIPIVNWWRKLNDRTC